MLPLLPINCLSFDFFFKGMPFGIGHHVIPQLSIPCTTNYNQYRYSFIMEPHYSAWSILVFSWLSSHANFLLTQLIPFFPSQHMLKRLFSSHTQIRSFFPEKKMCPLALRGKILNKNIKRQSTLERGNTGN